MSDETKNEKLLAAKERAKALAKARRETWKNSPQAKALKEKARQRRKATYQQQKQRLKDKKAEAKANAKAAATEAAQRERDDKREALMKLLRPASELPPPVDAAPKKPQLRLVKPGETAE